MVRVTTLLGALLLFVQVTSSTTMSEILSVTNEGEPNTPDKLEKVAEIVLRNNIHSAQVDSETSLFDLLIPVVASIAKISKSAQNKLYIEALFDHMNKVCLTAILKIKRGTITEREKEEIVQKIWLTGHETNFFNSFKIKITMPDKTLTLMLKVLTAIDSDSCNTRGMILKLAPFCESEECQELIYSSIIKSFKCQNNKKLPLLKIKYNLENTEKYDAFISYCYEMQKSEQSSLIPAETLVRNVINGPNTAVAADILINLMEREFLTKHGKYDDFVNNLTRLLLNTETFDHFSELFLSYNGDDRILDLKEKMQNIKADYDAIYKIISGSATSANDQDFMEYIDLFRNHKNALTSYYAIDREFVVDAVKELNFEISRLMNEFSKQPDEKLKLVYVSVCFIILNAIPSLPMREFIGTDYEIILDNYLSPEIQALNPVITLNHIIHTITLPFVRLNLSTLEKFLDALQRNTSDYIEKLQLTILLALFWRSFDDEIFMGTLEIVHRFYDSVELSMSEVISVLLSKLCQTRDNYLARKVLNYCRDHRLLPKTHDVIAEEYFSSFSF